MTQPHQICGAPACDNLADYTWNMQPVCSPHKHGFKDAAPPSAAERDREAAIAFMGRDGTCDSMLCAEKQIDLVHILAAARAEGERAGAERMQIESLRALGERIFLIAVGHSYSDGYQTAVQDCMSDIRAIPSTHRRK